MDIKIAFPGGKRVEASFGDFVVHTDQSRDRGGDASAPEPFDLFLTSLATCAGLYVLGFCQARGIPTEGLRLVQRDEHDPETKKLTKITLEIGLPPGFPEKYRGAVASAAAHCKVKQTLRDPPPIEVTTSVTEHVPLPRAS